MTFSAAAAALALALTTLMGGLAHAGEDRSISPKANYIERCGGCHGVDGRSVAQLVPDLKHTAAYFLCDEEARAYVARLPNVAFSQISDADLAAMLNYVVSDLGAKDGPSQPGAPAARPYTAAEVGRLRRDALTIPDLKAYRRRIVERLVARCAAPDRLLTDYQGPETPSP